MIKIKKIIALGLLVLGSTSALADIGLNDVQQSVKSDLKEFYVKIENTGLSSAIAALKINTITEENLKFSDTSTASSTGSGENCLINLDVSQNGKMHFLTEDDEILSKTVLKNETQQKMYREFVAAHEHTHCDFPKNGINVPKLNKEENNVLNGIYDLVKEYGFYDSHINYGNLVNENFADAGAMVLMLKMYGSDNKDLQYVISVVQSQRSQEAIGKKYGAYLEEHFTYNVFDEVKNSLNVINDLKTNDEFVSYLLKVANSAAMQSVLDKKEVSVDIAFSQTDRFVDNYITGYILSDIVQDMPVNKENNLLYGLASSISAQIDKNKMSQIINNKKQFKDITSEEKINLKIALLNTLRDLKEDNSKAAQDYKALISQLNGINEKMHDYSKGFTNYKLPSKESILGKIKKSQEQYDAGITINTVRKI